MITKEPATEQPMVSIIVAVFNGVKTLQRCIDGVADQTYPHTELIVMDGGSTDGTVDILRENANTIAYWESKPDKGISHAWNKALKHVCGEWVCFLGADDFFYNDDVLQKVAKELMNLPNDVKLAYGSIMMINKEMQELKCMGIPWGKAKKRFYIENTIPHQGCFHRVELFKEYGDFDELFKIAGDYEFTLRCIEGGGKVVYIPKLIVAKMQVGGLSSSAAFSYKVLREFKMARVRNNCESWTFAYYWLSFKAMIKRLSM